MTVCAKELRRETGSEIERSHLDCFKVWRYRGHLLSFLDPVVMYAADRKVASLPLSWAAFGEGAPGEGRTFLIRSIAKVIRSDRQGVFPQTHRPTRSARRFSVPVRSPMARVYANVNALSGPKWYDYGR